jgi:methylphosphotriester-DNA--protein-cysteine methyltransferase
MALVRKVNSTYNQVNSNLQILQKEEIIFDEHFGRMRVIRLNKKNPRTARLLQALKILETLEERQNSKNRPPQLSKTRSQHHRIFEKAFDVTTRFR